MASDLLGCLIRGSEPENLKRGAPDDENLHVPKFEKTRLGASERESMKGGGVRIGRDLKGDNCQEPISKRLRRTSMAAGGSQNVMDETVGPLLVVSKLIQCFISFANRSLSCIQDRNFKLID